MKPKWRQETIRKILKNKKYIEDALLQKAYTVDFLSKVRLSITASCSSMQYYVENSYELIIPRELFMQAQEELARQACLRIRNRQSRKRHLPTVYMGNIFRNNKDANLTKK